MILVTNIDNDLVECCNCYQTENIKQIRIDNADGGRSFCLDFFICTNCMHELNFEFDDGRSKMIKVSVVKKMGKKQRCHHCDHYAGGVCTEHGEEVEPVGFCPRFWRAEAHVGLKDKTDHRFNEEKKNEQP